MLFAPRKRREHGCAEVFSAQQAPVEHKSTRSPVAGEYCGAQWPERDQAMLTAINKLTCRIAWCRTPIRLDP